MNFVCIIPSRYASTRLPGKPLCDIAGKPMVQRVYEQASKASKLTAVVVAVDNPKVYDTVVSFWRPGCHDPGRPYQWDRPFGRGCGSFPDADVIINVQGDEPLIAPDVIDDLCHAFEDDPASPWLPLQHRWPKKNIRNRVP